MQLSSNKEVNEGRPRNKTKIALDIVFIFLYNYSQIPPPKGDKMSIVQLAGDIILISGLVSLLVIIIDKRVKKRNF